MDKWVVGSKINYRMVIRFLDIMIDKWLGL